MAGWGAILAGLARGLRRGPAGGDAERRRLGRAGERAARRALLRAGFRVLGRNVMGRVGEADLVCLDPDGRTIVVVEVKSRRAAPGSLPPEASVTAEKREKLRAVTRALVRANGWSDRPVRIDVVAVEWGTDVRGPVIRHHRGAG